jgi:ABC-type antimicrobial peptide transport system permease subunit
MEFPRLSGQLFAFASETQENPPGVLAYAIVMPARNIIGGVLIAVAIGVVSSLFPALLATRKDISTDLRAL